MVCPHRLDAAASEPAIDGPGNMAILVEHDCLVMHAQALTKSKSPQVVDERPGSQASSSVHGKQLGRATEPCKHMAKWPPHRDKPTRDVPAQPTAFKLHTSRLASSRLLTPQDSAKHKADSTVA